MNYCVAIILSLICSLVFLLYISLYFNKLNNLLMQYAIGDHGLPTDSYPYVRELMWTIIQETYVSKISYSFIFIFFLFLERKFCYKYAFTRISHDSDLKQASKQASIIIISITAHLGPKPVSLSLKFTSVLCFPSLNSDSHLSQVLLHIL